MNRFKTTPSSAPKKQAQNRSSNSSLSQNSTTTPKSAEKLSKPTVSTFVNNNVIVDMVRKASTGSNAGRPTSANTSKGKPSQNTSNVAQQQPQQKRPTTPVQNIKNPATASPTTTITGSPTPSPQKVPAASPVTPQQQQQKQPNNVPPQPVVNQQPPKQAPNPPPVPSAITQKPNNQEQSSNASGPQKAAAPSATASTSSIKSNGNQKPKSIVTNNQQQKQTVSANSNTNNNAKEAIKQGAQSNSVVFQRQSTKTFPSPVSQHRYPSNISRSMVSLERSRNFRAFIEKAMNDHKIFSCCGVYPAIRNALKKRGWVEKPGPLAYSRSANTTLSPNNRGPEDESDVAWMTRVMKDYAPDFIWVIRRDNIDWKSLTREQLINRFPKAWFTTKVGLAACLQHMHWFSEAGVSDTFFPRCYRLCLEEERQAFQDDYRLTACMSYLRYFVDTFETKGHAALADVHSKITPLSVDFASRQLGNYIRMRRHEDIDWLLPPNFMTQHWDAFIHQYYAVVHERKRLRFDSPEAVHVKYETAKKMLHKVAQYWPQMELDGKYNMWICKPGARSRGKGIVIMNTLEKIMDLMSQSNFRECNWVVQKYIEKPMLIYKTKFDIRQWFLITDWTPLTVWFYKESYVRFCTKPFILEDFHESIHLCNNAIQCRYQNSDQRDSNLPDENMWSSDTFQAYLKTIGRLDAWPLIYSGMKQAIVGVMLASQETVESRKGCYELYGADFMLTEDFRPWLIEINSCPCMAPSTSVTARMCAQCLEDTVKVVVDRRNNRNADTGMFEMIYRQNAGSVAVQQFSGHDLTVIGRKLTRDIDWPMTMSKSVTNVNPRKISQPALPQPSQSNNNNRQTLSELLQKLRVRNQEMFQGALASQQANMESILEGAATNPDATGSLLNKMRSLKSSSASQDQDIISGMKKVYPTPDPKLTGGSKQVPPIEKEASASGKGEDPSSISSKFTDMNSLAYLMRNSHNIAPDSKVNKRSEEKRPSPPPVEDPTFTTKPVPKTLADVKAMVEASNRQQQQQQNSEKYGKILSDNNFQELSNDLHKKCVRDYETSTTTEEASMNFTHHATHPISTDSAFENHSYENQTDNSDNSGTQRSSSPAVRTEDSITKPSQTIQTTVMLSKSTSAIRTTSETRATEPENETVDTLTKSTSTEAMLAKMNTVVISGEAEKPLDNNNEEEPIRRTKSLPFTTRHSVHSWVSTEDSLHLRQLSSRHSMTSRRVESQAYMIYPLPAHPSNDHFPCEEKVMATSIENYESLLNNLDTPGQNTLSNDESALNNEVHIDVLHMKPANPTEQNTLEEEPPLIDLVSSDTTVRAQLAKARESKTSANETNEDPQGKLYQSILFTTSSSSSSDNDYNDDNNNEINLASHFIAPTFGFRARPTNASVDATVAAQKKQGESLTKPKPPRFHHRRNALPSHRRCSRRFPCYRVILEPQNFQRLSSKKKTAATLPLKTVNLLLPPNCNNHY